MVQVQYRPPPHAGPGAAGFFRALLASERVIEQISPPRTDCDYGPGPDMDPERGELRGIAAMPIRKKKLQKTQKNTEKQKQRQLRRFGGL